MTLGINSKEVVVLATNKAENLLSPQTLLVTILNYLVELAPKSIKFEKRFHT
ncbi:hypothetical protein QCA50_014675 [Cerrena zonata]|uniref:Uncharacterized protein n=1 Tax=Cerrena zonata TaxID=2478898 RepID=A0AAW0FUZ6_9APHY